MHRTASIASSHLRYKVCIMPEAISHLSQWTGLMVNGMLLLPWCKAITGYQIKSSNKSNSQKQPTTSYSHTSKSLSGSNLPTRVKTTTNRIYTCQFKYANTIPTVLCMDNSLICGCITDIHFWL